MLIIISVNNVQSQGVVHYAATLTGLLKGLTGASSQPSIAIHKHDMDFIDVLHFQCQVISSAARRP